MHDLSTPKEKIIHQFIKSSKKLCIALPYEVMVFIYISLLPVRYFCLWAKWKAKTSKHKKKKNMKINLMEKNITQQYGKSDSD